MIAFDQVIYKAQLAQDWEPLVEKNLTGSPLIKFADLCQQFNFTQEDDEEPLPPKCVFS